MMGGRASKITKDIYIPNLNKVRGLKREYGHYLLKPSVFEIIKAKFDKLILSDNFRMYRDDAKEIFGIEIDNKNQTVDWKENTDRQLCDYFCAYYGTCLSGAGVQGQSQYERALGKSLFSYIDAIAKEAGITAVTDDSDEPKEKTDAQKRAERMQKHQTGVLPVTIPQNVEPDRAQNEDEDEDEYHVFTPLTLDEILTTPPLDFLTDNLIVRNTVNVFFAPAKTGKTYLCLNYAVSMAMGIPFVGMENHLKRNVGYLNLDMFRGGFNDRVKQVIKGFNPNATNEYISGILDKLKIIDREAIRGAGGHLPNFFKEQYLNDLKNFIVTNNIEFLFIDTFSRIRGGSAENDNDDMGATLQNIEKFFTPLECGCLLIHHTGKDGKLRGASSIIDNAEFVFGLRKVNGSNKHLQLFSDTPRYTDVFELDIYPVFEQVTNEDTGASRADSYFLTAVDPDADSNVYAQAVSKYLKEHGNTWMSKKNIAYHADGNYDLLRKEVDEMFAQGKLERVKSGNGFNYRMKVEGI